MGEEQLVCCNSKRALDFLEEQLLAYTDNINVVEKKGVLFHILGVSVVGSKVPITL